MLIARSNGAINLQMREFGAEIKKLIMPGAQISALSRGEINIGTLRA